jgi:putative methanogenesis marker protein 8
LDNAIFFMSSPRIYTMIIEDVIQRANRTFVHVGGDFVLIEDSPVECPFIRVKTWKDAWTALYLRKLQFGQFTEERKIKDSRKYVPFGASEIIMEAMYAGLLDAAVLVCDGAGTVITDDPSIVQGIGGRMSGLLYTVPRKKVINKLKKENATVLDIETAVIDPVKGAQKARELYSNVVVTITAGKDIELLNKMPELFVFVVHTTGVSATQAEYACQADIVWGCCSKQVRDRVGTHALVQLGVGIPVFVMTERAIRIILPQIKNLSDTIGSVLKEKISDIVSGESVVIHHTRTAHGMGLVMKKSTLPVSRHTGPRPLI